MSGFAALVAHGLVLVLLAADELGRPAVVLGDAGAQGPSHELLLVERGHAAGRRVAVHEEHEGHPFALPGLLVLHHGHLGDFAVLLEQLVQVVIRQLVREIAHVHGAFARCQASAHCCRDTGDTKSITK
uniref:Putative secreted protein n=1 Tax=Ixodes ricinus TaxID=34613 RepID=A0A6B0UQF3_IXORI